MNQTRKVTVLITSHDMDDIEQICKRTMIIDCADWCMTEELIILRNYTILRLR